MTGVQTCALPISNDTWSITLSSTEIGTMGGGVTNVCPATEPADEGKLMSSKEIVIVKKRMLSLLGSLCFSSGPMLLDGQLGRIPQSARQQ